MSQMMSLGMFVFSIDTAAYQALSRRAEWRHTSASRVGARPAGQYLGPGDETVSLSGALLPQLRGDPGSFDTLRQMGDQGEAWPLVDGTGVVHGAFVIVSLDEEQGEFFEDGVPRKYDFRLELRRQDDPALESSLAGNPGVSV